MKEDESKNATTAEEQPKDAQSVEGIETPDTTAGTAMEGPGDDAPADGQGCEAVTVVIVCQDPEKGALAAQSVKKNLVGVDADIHVVSEDNLRGTLPETLLEHLPHCKTERIILMTDGQMILNPVTLGAVACVKAKGVGGIDDYDAGMPVMMMKSVLEQLLPEMVGNLPYGSVVHEYFSRALPMVRPLPVGDWKIDPWLLPVVSKNPNVVVLSQMASWKKFIHVGPGSWTAGVTKFLEERFAE
ncbi:MAG: hypothetical protein IJ569_06795 [Prevotella sp.]|nr:hypothetical protein [Bacteroidaceae bacterium]MBR1389308.1 hypothetical protein [Prevotella sp.]